MKLLGWILSMANAIWGCWLLYMGVVNTAPMFVGMGFFSLCVAAYLLREL